MNESEKENIAYVWSRPLDKEELSKEIVRLDAEVSVLKHKVLMSKQQLIESDQRTSQIYKEWKECAHKWRRRALLAIGFSIALSLIIGSTLLLPGDIMVGDVCLSCWGKG